MTLDQVHLRQGIAGLLMIAGVVIITWQLGWWILLGLLLILWGQNFYMHLNIITATDPKLRGEEFFRLLNKLQKTKTY